MMGRFIKAPFVALVLVAALPGQAQNKYIAPELADLVSAPQKTAPIWIASTDPKHQNNDFFWLEPGQTRRVPLAPGRLVRLWSTSSEPAQLKLSLQNGADIPLLTQNRAVVGLWSGDEGKKAFSFLPPKEFRRLDKGAALIATNGAKARAKWYFQATISPSPPARPLPAFSGVDRRQFKIALAPGEEKTLENWDAPGLIYEISVAGATDFQKIRLRGEWEGQVGLDAPLMALAGQQAGKELIQNAVSDFDGSRLMLRWPMPFAKAKLALKNEGSEAQNVDVGVRLLRFNSVPSDFRFCAVSQSAVAEDKKPISILKLQGAGAFCGLALAIAPGEGSTRRTFAYLEGNEFLMADGKKYEGTGTEDYFSSAWYFPEKPFFHPYEGLTQKIAMPPQVAAYRLQIPDALPFQKSLAFDFEHGNGNNAAGMTWNWTAYWYQKAPFSLPTATEAPIQSGGGERERKDSKNLIFGALLAGVLVGVVASYFRKRRAN